ncbi:tripartite tricarboxylate transporter permease [Bacillus sinesaloumensis]|uniref:tripartite tricarboxylate transporter permease n=1 Tax=Litchfieldia sinesaloumensis TaxID=1926280 RepID=UPI00135659C2|nr:tripartite tricarboxylate transporter permease [Bacillus sinesaloumensis]
MIDQIIDSALQVLQPETIILVLLGVAVGQIVGGIPGMTGTMVMALLMPLTFAMPIWVGVPMLLGILKGALFGGSVSAVMLKTPGTPAALATTFDGYPMAQQGKGKKAIKMALVASTIGDTFGTICLIFLSGIIASVAIMFGAPEYAIVILCALLILGTLQGRSFATGMLSAGIGLLLGTVGVDPVVGLSRLSFNNPQLYSGIELVPLLIGLLTIPEIIKQMEGTEASKRESAIRTSNNKEDNKLYWKEIKKDKGIKNLFRSSTIGMMIGSIPGLGAEVAGIVSYNQEVLSSKNPEKYGKGEIKGVAATESANSAAGASNLIPYLSLGIPGDTSIAVIAGAFLVHGITVGPMMFEESPGVLYAIFIGLLIASLLNLLVGHIMIPVITKVLTVPKGFLFPSVFVIAAAGTYAFRGSFFDVGIMMAFGLIGYILMKLDISVIPLMIAFILGPMLETQVRRTAVLIKSEGSVLFLFQRPLFVILLLVLIGMTFLIIRFKRRSKLVE